MIPGHAEPRRPNKVQSKPPTSSSTNAPGEDLTPDYMNILGPESTTGNAEVDIKTADANRANEPPLNIAASSQRPEEKIKGDSGESMANSTANATSIIPTSPQYGVAIMSNNDTAVDIAIPSNDVGQDGSKLAEVEIKDMHSTPSKNDRFKVVKIASSEPFRRGRWKCMDYVDESPPLALQQTKFTTQTTSPVQVGGAVYMQTQSLPPQHIQQMLVQGGYTNSNPQYYQNSVQSQVVPQTQYFYPAMQNQGGVQPQSLPQQMMIPGSIPQASIAQYVPSSQQAAYFQPGMVAPNAVAANYQNVQYVQSTLIQNQNSAFVPAAQSSVPTNVQQGQSYSGRPNITQSNVPQTQNYSDSQNIVVTQPQTLVNGFPYPQQITDQQVTTNALPTQVAKNVILNSNIPPQVNQSQIPNVQQPPQDPQANQNPTSQPVQNIIPQTQFTDQNPPYQPQPTPVPHVSQVIPPSNPVMSAVAQNVVVPQQNFDANPSSGESQHAENATEAAGVNDATEDNGGDLTSRTNPVVVNAIDNKIEQAMDLVKSHLMFTVREEVEVLKEKITELMERIQQLESENNFLRSQIPKNANSGSEPAPPQ